MITQSNPETTTSVGTKMIVKCLDSDQLIDSVTYTIPWVNLWISGSQEKNDFFPNSIKMADIDIELFNLQIFSTFRGRWAIP